MGDWYPRIRHGNMDYETINERMVDFELQAFSELFHYWATERLYDKKFTTEKKKKCKESSPTTKYAVISEKLIAFRKSLLSPEYDGQDRDYVPQEIVYDDLKLCWDCIVRTRELRKSGSSTSCFTLPVEDDEITMPFPCPPKLEDSIMASKATPKEDAIIVTEGRLPVGSDAIEKIYKRSANRLKKGTKLTWRLLAALFLELNFYKDNANQAKVLDTLIASGYSPLKLYYLVQISHSIDWQMSLDRWKQDQIDKLCNMVCPDYQEGPFTKLIQA